VLRAEQARAIVDEYYQRFLARGTTFAEWYSIDPPFPSGSFGMAAGKGPGPESSVLKIKGSEIQQRLTELTLEMAGHYGAPYFRGFGEGDNEHPIGPAWANRAAPTYFNVRKTTIYGGSNEIQRNIVAQTLLGS